MGGKEKLRGASAAADVEGVLLDDWDDDEVTGDFSQALMAEIEKCKAAAAAGAK